MKKILLCSDSFKGTLISEDIINIASEVVNDKYSSFVSLKGMNIADGGEGTLSTFRPYINGDIEYIKTIDAEGNPIDVPLLINDKTAFIEVAKIIGLPLIKNTVPPLKRTTYGVGLIIKELVNRGIKIIYVALGGSSTSDLGIGMLDALGVNFGYKYSNLENVLNFNKIDLSNFYLKDKDIHFILLSDVSDSVLGAVNVYAKQKGYKNDLGYLDKCFHHFINLANHYFQKDFYHVPSLGASGALAAAFYIFCTANIVSGIELFLTISNFKELVKEYDYVITGEGSFDEQSLHGKVINGVLSSVDLAKVILIVGKAKIKIKGLKIYEISPSRMSFDELKKTAKANYKITFSKVLNDLLKDSN